MVEPELLTQAQKLITDNTMAKGITDVLAFKVMVLVPG